MTDALRDESARDSIALLRDDLKVLRAEVQAIQTALAPLRGLLSLSHMVMLAIAAAPGWLSFFWPRAH